MVHPRLTAFYHCTKGVKKTERLYVIDPITILLFPISLFLAPFHNWIKFQSMAEIDKGWQTRPVCIEEGATTNAEILVHFIRVVLSVFIWAVETSATYPFIVIIRIIKFVCGIIFECLDRQSDAASLW